MPDEHESGVAVADDSGQQAEQSQEQQSGGQQHVPLDVVHAMRDEQQQLKDKLETVTNQYELLRESMTARRQEPQQETESPRSDDDLVSYGDARKFQTQMRVEMQEMRMQQAHPDYSTTVNKYLGKAIKEDPSIAHDIEMYVASGKDAAQYAYKRAKLSRAYQEENREQKRSEVAQKVVTNSKQPGNLSQVGTPAPMNERSPYREMSDAEFRTLMNKHTGLI